MQRLHGEVPLHLVFRTLQFSLCALASAGDVGLEDMRARLPGLGGISSSLGAACGRRRGGPSIVGGRHAGSVHMPLTGGRQLEEVKETMEHRDATLPKATTFFECKIERTLLTRYYLDATAGQVSCDAHGPVPLDGNAQLLGTLH